MFDYNFKLYFGVLWNDYDGKIKLIKLNCKNLVTLYNHYGRPYASICKRQYVSLLGDI